MVSKLILFSILILSSFQLLAVEKLRIFTWPGYVTTENITQVNKILADKGYNYKVEVLATQAEDADQMFSVIRKKQCDITFLTLFFIKMHGEQISKLLQPIDINSPRLSNYKNLDANLTQIPMGMQAGKPLYIPWGGGIYGFYVDTNKVKQQDIPKSVKDLWSAKWRNKFSLNQGQFWYNVGLTLQALDYPPFYLEQLAQKNDRSALKVLLSKQGVLLNKFKQFYNNAGGFWQSSTQFSEDLEIVSSWGPEIKSQNDKGGKWQLINFEEGHLAWLDTINFVRGLKNEKLAAAEVVANYFIGKKVQQRIVDELSMLPASVNLDSRGLLDRYPNLFRADLFVPPYSQLSYSLMQQLVEQVD
ncbi:hypothetical protein GAB14E_3215 [Colwellia psychrerythraea]|uniref:Spermidine/putrescine ABC transporter substrate-binding protein n=1 Tax=Colwellia psychrerythraea TaxID=28229 RepID=A0A099KQ25_COLPS|nr:hypothetical protein GAB14E_3215 [Colwellia psychrerythraea]